MFSAVFLALNFVSGIFGFLFIGPGQEIAWQAHLGGYVAGLLLTTAFERYFGMRRRVS
jgi:membrane associated rhomboid family serine protease